MINLNYTGKKFIFKNAKKFDSVRDFLRYVATHPETVYEKDGKTHCLAGCNRSLRDSYHLCKQYFDISEEDFLREVAHACKNKLITVQYCVVINHLVICKGRYNFYINPSSRIDANNIGGSGKQSNYLRSLL